MARLFLVWLLLASTVGFAVYQLKYEVQTLDDDLTRLNRQIIADQESIHVLKAEWSYLNQATTLEQANQKFLGLETIKGRQFATIDSLPRKGEAWKAPRFDQLPPPRPDATPEIKDEEAPDSFPEEFEDMLGAPAAAAPQPGNAQPGKPAPMMLVKSGRTR